MSRFIPRRVVQPDAYVTLRNAQDLIDEYWERVAKNNAKKLGPRKSDAKLATASAASQKRLSPDEVESVPAPPKKRGRPPKEKPAPESEDEEPNTRAKPTPAKRGRKSTTQSTKKGRDSNAMDEDVPGDYTNMRKWRDSPSWEHLVHHIDTVERTDDGKLYCYFQLYVPGLYSSISQVLTAGFTRTKQHNDRVCREETSLCRQKMPNMVRSR